MMVETEHTPNPDTLKFLPGKNVSEIVEKKKSSSEIQAKHVSLQEIKNNTGTLVEFEKGLLENKSTIGIILGARGTGKSAIGMRLLENFKAKTNKDIYALGFKESSLPSWISAIK